MRLFVTLLFTAFSFVLLGQEVSTRYELVKMDKTVNTFRHEAAPVVSPDGKTLYFFVQNHPENTYGKDDTQDIWMTRKDAQGVWSPAEHLRSPFNIHPSNQVFTILPDGNIFIKGGRNKGEKGFSVANPNGGLQELNVKDFKKMNAGRFYGATMSADKRHIIMYFSEKENSPISDLYASHLQGDGSYSQPVKLKLSTSLDEVGPFISPDQKTLYFGSARQAPGRQGGVDIYKSTRLDDTWMNWSEPVNLGKPVNTGALDYYFTVDTNGNIFTSRANKALEGAQLDLYMLVPKTFGITLAGTVYNQKTNDPLQADVEIRLVDQGPLKLRSDATGKFESKIPEVSGYALTASLEGFLPASESVRLPVIYSDTTIHIDIPLTPIAKPLVLNGKVYDKKTNKQITASLDVVIKGENKHAPLKINAPNGTYQREVQSLGWYVITASSEGYLNSVDSVWINDSDVTPVTKDLMLQPIEVGVTVRLKNIYFDFDKTTLKDESFPELNKVVDFLKQNESVEIEISGHTDNKGSDDYNATLSQGRSEAVVNYLISQGVDSFRLAAHGYGESKPIDTNDSDEGRANNRRVEFTITKK
ncbi:MAG TPA: OmpA family protein [Chryseosolibacter sp.]|nr:OmpA family protein [Chryseosolibacter sp.]